MTREDAQKFLEAQGFTTEVHDGVLYCLTTRKKTPKTAFARTYKHLIAELRSIGYTASFGFKYGKVTNED